MRRRAAAGSAGDSPVGTTAPVDLGSGPHDADHLDLDEDPTFAGHLDLGGLLVAPPPPGVDIRLQIDEHSGEVISVVLAGEDGAVELRAFAASRNGELWADVRRAIAAETAQHGGTANERNGDFGTELVTQLPVTAPDGSSAIQPSRVIGVTGARWLLRATILGRPAVEPDDAQVWEDQIRAVVVRRGLGAMPPGEAIALTLPAGVEPGAGTDEG